MERGRLVRVREKVCKPLYSCRGRNWLDGRIWLTP